MFRSISISALVLSTLTLFGCDIEPDGTSEGISLVGEVGTVSSALNTNVQADGGSDDFGTYLNVWEDEAAGGSIMGGIALEGIDLHSLAPGTIINATNLSGAPRISVTGPDGATTRLDDDEVFVSGIGCSGESPGSYNLDVPAERVSIEIEKGQRGEVVVAFENVLEDDMGTVAGSAILQ